MSHVDEGRLSAFLDGALDPEVERAIEEHLADCRECAASFEEVSEVHARAASLLDDIDVRTEAPDFAALAARARETEPLEQGPGFLLPGLAWAATLVLAFFLGWQSSNRSVLTTTPEPVPPAARTERERPPESMRALVDETSPAEADAATDPAAEAELEAADPDVAATPPIEHGDSVESAETAERVGDPAAAAAPPPVSPVPPAGAWETTEERRQRETARAESDATAATREAIAPERFRAVQEGVRITSDGEVPGVRQAAARNDSTGAVIEPETIFLRDGAARELPAGIRLEVEAMSADWLGAPPMRLEGATLLEVRVVPATVFPDGLAGRTVLHSTYLLPGSSTRVDVWQQWLGDDSADAGAADALAEAPAAVRSDGLTQLEWDDPRGYRIRVMAPLPLGELRALAQRLTREVAR